METGRGGCLLSPRKQAELQPAMSGGGREIPTSDRPAENAVGSARVKEAGAGLNQGGPYCGRPVLSRVEPRQRGRKDSLGNGRPG